MTVLIVPSWYKTDSNPNLGSFFREQALMLAKRGIKVIVADATLQGKADYRSKRCFRMQCVDDEGLLTYSYVIPALGISRMQNAGTDIFYVNLKKIFKRIIRDGHKIDLIHAHSYLPAGFAACKLGKMNNIPVIVTEHASDVLIKNISERRKYLLAETVDKSEAFICVSNALRSAVTELTHTSKKIYVIPNAVCEKFNAKNKSNDPFFNFITVGNLVESKRFDLVIKAFAELCKKNSKIKLKIVGSGNMLCQLEELVSQHGLKDRVLFRGRLDRDSVVKEMQNSDAFVLASDFETFGVVYVEALACGLPVIGTRNGGAEDIIGVEDGILIDKGNEEQLTRAMKYVYTNYLAFNKEKIEFNCRKRFGEDTVVDNIIDIYNQKYNEFYRK